MGVFVAFDDPLVERTIEGHLRQIVSAIRCRMEPEAIILNGSFGRGEGSVCLDGGRMRFLSDYEIDVATFSPFWRSCFRGLSRQLTAQTGVSTGIRWVRPDYLRRGRIGPIPWLPAPVTISLYETRYGSRTLYGDDFVQRSAEVDPTQIAPESGLRLMLNRMAESLFHMSLDSPRAGDLTAYHWISKTVLSCAESMLVLWGSYHYSYRERSLRFRALSGRLDSLGKIRGEVTELVDRATEFKLVPRADIYHDSPRDTWLSVIAVVRPIFRLLVKQTLGISLNDYEQFGRQYVRRMSEIARCKARSEFWLGKLVEAEKSIRARRFPLGLFDRRQPASEVVYGAVPLLFLSYGADPKTGMLEEARRQLASLEDLDAPNGDSGAEWDYLRRKAASDWRIFCY